MYKRQARPRGEDCPHLVSHQLFLGAGGMIDGAALGVVNRTRMNLTIAAVLQRWDWASTWGWDYGLVALAMARHAWSGEAIADLLLMNVVKNSYPANGYNFQEAALAAYLPGNGGLLAAIAMLCGDGAEPPRFPSAWGVVCEGFPPYPP